MALNSELNSELIQKLFSKCHQLTEVNLNFSWQWNDHQYCALVENLTPNILKLNLQDKYVKDEHVTTLVQRCNKLKELNLRNSKITDDSVKRIVERLNSLEKLDVKQTYINFTSLLQLKSIPTLKILYVTDTRGYRYPSNEDEIKNLQLQLPHISVNKPEDLNIA